PILGLNLLLVSAMVSTLWAHAVRRGLVRPDADDTEVRLLAQRLTPGLAGYVAMILLGLVLPIVAVLGYLVIALALLIPAGLRRVRSILLPQRNETDEGPGRCPGPSLTWWRGWDLNPRPSGYEPDELPDCSTPRRSGPTR